MEVNPALVGSTLENYPLKTLLISLAEGIAEAQIKLDEGSIRTASQLIDKKISLQDANGRMVEKSLLELGFMPTFYHFESAVIKVSVTITMKVEESTSTSVGASLSLSHSTNSTQTGTPNANPGTATNPPEGTTTPPATSEQLGGTGTKAERVARLVDDNTLPQLEKLATDRGLPKTGPKKALATRIIDFEDNKANTTPIQNPTIPPAPPPPPVPEEEVKIGRFKFTLDELQSLSITDLKRHGTTVGLTYVPADNGTTTDERKTTFGKKVFDAAKATP